MSKNDREKSTIKRTKKIRKPDKFLKIKKRAKNVENNK